MKNLTTTILFFMIASFTIAQGSVDSGLVAFYPFNGNANDESGNTNNPTFIGTGVTLTTDRFGNANKAYYFDGNTDSYIRIPADNFPTTDRTISFWFYADQIENHPTPLSYGGDVCNNSVLMIINKGDYPNAYTVLSHCAANFISAPYSSPPINNWYYLTMTISGVTQKIFINGELQETANTFSTPTFVAGKSAILGALLFTDGYTVYVDPSAGYFKGKLDDFRFYNTAMTDLEVQNLYNNEANGLVAFFPFNGNADDESGNNNNGTVSGASLTQDRFGINSKAYSFNGTDNYITIADNPNLFSDELTISWWYKMTEILGGERVVIGWVDGGHRYQQFFNGGQLSYLNGYNVAQPGMYFNPIYGLNDLNVWKHVVVTYKKTVTSTSTTSIYVDGELKQTDNHTLAMDYVPGINFFIGKNHNNNNYRGLLDDFRIYNRVLSDEEITELYNDSTTYNPPLEDGLVAYWPFDGNTDDSTSFNNDGINYNGVFSKDRYANDTSAIYFDGVDSYIEGINPGNNLPVGNSPRTFSAWIRNNQYNQYGSNIFHYGTQQAAPTNFHFLLTDVLGLGNGYGYGVVYGNTNLIDSSWHFVTGVYEGGTERTTKLYIDGKLDVTGAITTEPNTVLTNNWRMGRFMEGSSNFNGSIDELKVYDIPLTDQQVWDRYKATTTAPTLLYPGNDSTLINPTMIGLVLDWDSTVTATGYRFLLANDSLFNSVIHDTLVNTSSFDFYDWFSVNIDNLYWKVRTITNGGVGPWSLTNRFNIMLTDVEDETQLPTEFALFQNYPNPFNPTTTITYHLPKTANVELKVYDVLGNEIATLVNEEKSPGVYNVEFGTGSTELSSGIYFYKITAGEFVQTKKMILVK